MSAQFHAQDTLVKKQINSLSIEKQTIADFTYCTRAAGSQVCISSFCSLSFRFIRWFIHQIQHVQNGQVRVGGKVVSSGFPTSRVVSTSFHLQIPECGSCPCLSVSSTITAPCPSSLPHPCPVQSLRGLWRRSPRTPSFPIVFRARCCERCRSGHVSPFQKKAKVLHKTRHTVDDLASLSLLHLSMYPSYLGSQSIGQLAFFQILKRTTCFPNAWHILLLMLPFKWPTPVHCSVISWKATSSGTLWKSAVASLTTRYWLGGINTRNLFSHSSGGWMSKSGCYRTGFPWGLSVRLANGSHLPPEFPRGFFSVAWIPGVLTGMPVLLH